MHHYKCRCYYVYVCVCHEISDIPRFKRTSTILKDVAHQFAPWEVPPSCPGRRKGQALKPWSRQREPSWKTGNTPRFQWQFQWEIVIKKNQRNIGKSGTEKIMGLIDGWLYSKPCLTSDLPRIDWENTPNERVELNRNSEIDPMVMSLLLDEILAEFGDGSA